MFIHENDSVFVVLIAKNVASQQKKSLFDQVFQKIKLVFLHVLKIRFVCKINLESLSIYFHSFFLLDIFLQHQKLANLQNIHSLNLLAVA